MTKVDDVLSGLARTVRDLESRTARDPKAASGPAMYFDWWAFPVNSTSSYVDKYSVGDVEIAALKSNKSFQENYHKMIGLYFKSMGWNIESGTKLLEKIYLLTCME